MMRKLRARRNFASDENGAATIEAVLWLPMFFYILSLSVDVTMIFHAYSRVVRAVEDVNRGLSIGRITSIDEGKAKLASSLASYSGMTSSIAIVDGVVVTNVAVPVSSLVVTGAASLLMSNSVQVKTQQYVEF
jgi:Flp pilus assembly protein TadG